MEEVQKRQIIKIDPEKCDGCGLCVSACAEGALQLVNGKAKLVSESYCDGLGACLPECPAEAITIEEREAAPFDEAAVQKYLEKRVSAKGGARTDASLAQADPTCPAVNLNLDCGCRSTEMLALQPAVQRPVEGPSGTPAATSQLRQWPCQLRLVPINAPYLERAHLLIAADCTAYAYPNIHEFMRGKITLIACPKLDSIDYAAKLTEILELNEIKSITLLKMEVPCCGRLLEIVKSALRHSGKLLPWRVMTISIEGMISEEY